MFEEIISKNEEVRNSRLKRVMEEMNYSENFPFIVKENINYCIICEKDDQKEIELHSFGEYHHHLLAVHGESNIDLIIYLLEQILEAVLFQKRMSATSKGDISN